MILRISLVVACCLIAAGVWYFNPAAQLASRVKHVHALQAECDSCGHVWGSKSGEIRCPKCGEPLSWAEKFKP